MLFTVPSGLQKSNIQRHQIGIWRYLIGSVAEMNPSLKKFHAVLFLTLVLALPLAQAPIAHSSQSDRTLSFVTDALQLDMAKYAITDEGHDAVNTLKGFWMNGSYYSLESGENKIDVSCRYRESGEGIWYITIKAVQATTGLPLCIQPSANVLDRAEDFLERYQEWTGNSSLKEVINTLNNIDATENMTTTLGSWKLTVTSNPYFTSFYWQFTLNRTEYRGLGITFLDKYVFFRDDRNLPLISQSPPDPFGSSLSLVFLGIDYPDPNSTNVPLTTDLILETSRPAGIIELYLNHEAKIADVTSEMVPVASGRYTFNLAEPLQPYTTYTATVIYGQAIPPDFDSSPIDTESWNFTTGDFMTSQSENNPLSTIIYASAILGAIITAIAATIILLKRRNKQETEKLSNSQ